MSWKPEKGKEEWKERKERFSSIPSISSRLIAYCIWHLLRFENVNPFLNYAGL
jgi:hypothetical protein